LERLSEIKFDKDGNIITEEISTVKYDFKKDSEIIIKTPTLKKENEEPIWDETTGKRIRNPIHIPKLPWKYIILAVALIGISILIISLFSNTSYYSNTLSQFQDFNLNSFVNIVLNQTNNQKIASLSFTTFANAELIHPANLAVMSIGTDVNIDFISHCDIRNPNFVNCYNVFISQNLEAGTPSPYTNIIKAVI
jgi:hypothetical protein